MKRTLVIPKWFWDSVHGKKPKTESKQTINHALIQFNPLDLVFAKFFTNRGFHITYEQHWLYGLHYNNKLVGYSSNKLSNAMIYHQFMYYIDIEFSKASKVIPLIIYARRTHQGNFARLPIEIIHLIFSIMYPRVTKEDPKKKRKRGLINACRTIYDIQKERYDRGIGCACCRNRNPIFGHALNYINEYLNTAEKQLNKN